MKVTMLSSQKFSSLLPASRRPNAQAMAASLRAKGVTVSDADVRKISASIKRTNALHHLDFPGKKTAFEHIERIASAKKMVNGKPSAQLAGELFVLAGAARSADFGKCYARTTHTIYSVHHAGEMSRIVADLAVKGEVKMADGTKVTWNPRRFSLEDYTPHVDMLWGALNHLMKAKKLPPNPTLSNAQEMAYQGEMANLTSRLMGERFVNVDGSEAGKKLNPILSERGPMLAEYGSHGGSLAKIQKGEAYSLEEGNTVPEVQYSLGYVVMPSSELRKNGIKAMTYQKHDRRGYIDRSRPAPEPAKGAKKAPKP